MEAEKQKNSIEMTYNTVRNPKCNLKQLDVKDVKRKIYLEKDLKSSIELSPIFNEKLKCFSDEKFVKNQYFPIYENSVNK
jgi:hypothetical protein